MIDSDTDREPANLASITGQRKPDLACNTVIEWVGGKEDIRDAETIIAKKNPSLTLAEVKKNLGQDDEDRRRCR
ncbi:MAG: hypothetical protein WBA63_07040 [Thermomicrobiales bacterium]